MNIFLKRLGTILPEGSMVLMFVTALGIILAYAREAVIAYYFGASAELDAFLVALTIPQLIATQSGMITLSVLLPEYVKFNQNRENSGLSDSLVKYWLKKISWTLFGLGFICVVWPEFIISITGPGLSNLKKMEAEHWLQLLTPYMILMGIIAPLRVILEARRAFFVPYFTGSLISICIILSSASSIEYLGVAALVLGYLSGGFLAFIFHLIRIKMLNPSYFLAIAKNEDYIFPIGSAYAMILVSFSSQISIVIYRAFASTLEEGSIAVLNYSHAIVAMPGAILSAAIGAAIFPKLSELVANKKVIEAFALTKKWVATLVLIMACVATSICFFRIEITSLLFQRGKFDLEALIATGTMLAILPLTLLASAASIILNRFILARQGAKWLATVSIFALSLQLISIYPFIRIFGLPGIAIAEVSIAALATLIRFNIAKKLA